MKVKDIMITNVVSVGPQAKILEIAKIFLESRFHGMPVVENDKVIGMITENDFFTKGGDSFYLPSYIDFLKETEIVDNLSQDKKNNLSQLLNTRVKDVMTSGCTSVSPDTDIGELLRVIKETKFNTIPVTDPDKKLLGIITLIDVIGLVKSNDIFKKIVGEKEENTSEDRQVDQLAQNVHSWWKRKFVFIGKSKMRTWEGVFIIAFIAGVATALIWAVSISIR